MRLEIGVLKGRRFEVREELALLGVVRGDAVVRRGGILHVHGVVEGDLIVEAGGKAFVRGIVLGSVKRRGGECAIHPAAAIHNGAL